MRGRGLVVALALVASGSVAPAGSAQQFPVPGEIETDYLSQGGKAWWLGPDTRRDPPGPGAALSFGSNVNANDPNQDLAAGQSETAIAVAGRRVMVAWNDATGFLVQPSTDRRASLTGAGFSTDGGRTFTDLLGLPNNKPNQQWFGDPTIVAVDGGKYFIFGSLYLPSVRADCAAGPVRFALAVIVARVTPAGDVIFDNPVIAADGGNLCRAQPPADLAFLDKEWLSYDPDTRTLVMSYTSFRFFGLGTGQIEIVRAQVPPQAEKLSRADWSAPIVVWPEEPGVVNQGAYVAAAQGGNAYVGWERNWFSNLFNGDPFVYVHAALIPRRATSPRVGGPADPRIITLGQVNSSPRGGVKSLDAVAIAGYNRGIGNDFPRLALDRARRRVVFVWNDASLHPLGDIWMRVLNYQLDLNRPIRRVNDDDSFALHFMPAVSVRGDGSIATSWYDRRRNGADSAQTEYFGEIRSSPGSQARDFRITTGPTNWTNTSTLIIPNFGDYTDNASDGTTTYFTWADGRIGVPQPFVDSH